MSRNLKRFHVSGAPKGVELAIAADAPKGQQLLHAGMGRFVLLAVLGTVFSTKIIRLVVNVRGELAIRSKHLRLRSFTEF